MTLRVGQLRKEAPWSSRWSIASWVRVKKLVTIVLTMRLTSVVTRTKHRFLRSLPLKKKSQKTMAWWTAMTMQVIKAMIRSLFKRSTILLTTLIRSWLDLTHSMNIATLKTKWARWKRRIQLWYSSWWDKHWLMRSKRSTSLRLFSRKESTSRRLKVRRVQEVRQRRMEWLLHTLVRLTLDRQL